MSKSDAPPNFSSTLWLWVRNHLFVEQGHLRNVAKQMNCIQHEYHRLITFVATSSRKMAEAAVFELGSTGGDLNANISALAGGPHAILVPALHAVRMCGNLEGAHYKPGAPDYTRKRDAVEAALFVATYLAVLRLGEGMIFDGVQREDRATDANPTGEQELFEPQLWLAFEELRVTPAQRQMLALHGVTCVADLEGLEIADFADTGMPTLFVRKVLTRVKPLAQSLIADKGAATDDPLPASPGNDLRHWYTSAKSRWMRAKTSTTAKSSGGRAGAAKSSGGRAGGGPATFLRIQPEGMMVTMSKQAAAVHPPGAILQVVGAGTNEVNGYYKANGKHNDKPQYRKVGAFTGVGCTWLGTILNPDVTRLTVTATKQIRKLKSVSPAVCAPCPPLQRACPHTVAPSVRVNRVFRR